MAGCKQYMCRIIDISWFTCPAPVLCLSCACPVPVLCLSCAVCNFFSGWTCPQGCHWVSTVWLTAAWPSSSNAGVQGPTAAHPQQQLDTSASKVGTNSSAGSLVPPYLASFRVKASSASVCQAKLASRAASY
jgi:hypothetical protein